MSNDFANDYADLINKAKNMNNMTISSVTNETFKKTLECRDFKTTGTKRLDACQIKAISLPLLAYHVLRESSHYVRLLKNYKHN